MPGTYRNPNYYRDWGNSLWKCPICHHKMKTKSRWCHQKYNCLIVNLSNYVQEIRETLKERCGR